MIFSSCVMTSSETAKMMFHVCFHLSSCQNLGVISGSYQFNEVKQQRQEKIKINIQKVAKLDMDVFDLNQCYVFFADIWVKIVVCY